MKAVELSKLVIDLLKDYLGYYVIQDSRLPAIWIGNILTKVQVFGLEVQIPLTPESASFGNQVYSQSWTIYLIQHNEPDGTFLNSNLINAQEVLLRNIRPSRSNYLPNARRDPDLEVTNAIAFYWDYREI